MKMFYGLSIMVIAIIICIFWYRPMNIASNKTFVVTQDYVIRGATMKDEQALKILYKKVAATPGGLARNTSEITDTYIHKTLFAGVNNGLALVVQADGIVIGSMIKYHLDPKAYNDLVHSYCRF